MASQLIFGTWNINPENTENCVKTALSSGFRGIDCSPAYQNEKEVGKALSDALQGKIPGLSVNRSDLFITSKLWNTCHRPEHVPKALEKTLHDLNLDYLDLYLIHWPIAFEFTNLELDPDFDFDEEIGGVKFAHGVTIHDTWKAMEGLLESGKVKAIGVANCNAVILLQILANAKVKPAVNQIEVHPYNVHQDLSDFCKARGIQIQAYSPLANGRSDGPLNDPLITEIAQKHQKSPAQILLRWNIQTGNTVLSKSQTPETIKENQSVFSFELNNEEVNQITGLDKQKAFLDTREFWGFAAHV